MADLDVLLGGRLFCDLVFSGSSLPEPGAEVFADAFVLSPGGTADRATAVTVAVTDEHDRSSTTYEEAATEVPREWPGQLPTAATCHVGVAGEVPGWVDALRAARTVVFGGVGWDASREWSPAVLDRLAHVDVFVPDEVEATSCTRTDDALAAARVLAERVGTVVVTRGARGSLAVDGSGAVVEEPAPVVPVVDPTGAGDVFVAGLMTATRLGWGLRDRRRCCGSCKGPHRGRGTASSTTGR
ncbi:PfkB family carbohydrate kinase [Kineococcus aurantiacus]|uniref:Sugar/nucleoside kinase (Ribokinase family) n=1 Tax=Kineococcus aurantiacus TaxID=37633 RepID=A0A7Y9DLJ6_9ACTN|nr:sugar/nucleoside kinase (ribokinase family) [Kineococcus aurantiacus]